MDESIINKSRLINLSRLIGELLISLILISLHFLPSPNEESDGSSDDEDAAYHDDDDGPNRERMSVVKNLEVTEFIHKNHVFITTVDDLIGRNELSRSKI